MPIFPLAMVVAFAAGFFGGAWLGIVRRPITPEHAVYAPPRPSRDHRVSGHVRHRYELPMETPRY